MVCSSISNFGFTYLHSVGLEMEKISWGFGIVKTAGNLEILSFHSF